MAAKYIYIAPHLDDAVLSCGGLIFEQVRAGHQVEVWTLTAGIPDSSTMPPFGRELNAKWGIDLQALQTRREEDIKACRVLGAQAVHLDWLDCIYRWREDGTPLVNNDDELFSAQPEPALVEEIALWLKAHVPAKARLVGPLGVGGHVDHRLTVGAVEKSGLKSLFYADYPYVRYHFEWAERFESGELKRQPFVIGKEGVEAWQEAVLCYRSQLSTFWRTKRECQLSIANYSAGGGGRIFVCHRDNLEHPQGASGLP